MINWEHLCSASLFQRMTQTYGETCLNKMSVAIDITYCTGHRNSTGEIPHLLDFVSHWRSDWIPITDLSPLTCFPKTSLQKSPICACGILGFLPTSASVLVKAQATSELAWENCQICRNCWTLPTPCKGKETLSESCQDRELYFTWRCLQEMILSEKFHGY